MRTNQTAPKDIDEYIAGFPNDVQQILEKISVNYALRLQESATSLIAPSGQCQAYLPYGQEGLLVQAIKVEEATGLLATRYAPERYQE